MTSRPAMLSMQNSQFAIAGRYFWRRNLRTQTSKFWMLRVLFPKLIWPSTRNTYRLHHKLTSRDCKRQKTTSMSNELTSVNMPHIPRTIRPFPRSKSCIIPLKELSLVPHAHDPHEWSQFELTLGSSQAGFVSYLTSSPPPHWFPAFAPS